MSIAEDFNALPKAKKPRKSRKVKRDAVSLASFGDNIAMFSVPSEPSSMDPSISESGAIHIPTGDGGIVIDFNPPEREVIETKHGDNLANKIDQMELSKIAEELLSGIAADEDSRSEWLNARSEGIDLLGFKLEKPRSGPSSGAAEGISVVRHPLLQEAVIRFQANATGELLPSQGPVKVRNDSGNESEEMDDLADALERDMNHYLTVTAKEYYPDTRRMLFMVGFGGCGFKKVYNCPIRRRPVSESVDAKDLIVSNAATDLENASRVTHVIQMRKSVLKRMQLLGVYRDISIGTPMDDQADNPVDQKIANVSGVQFSARTEDHDYQIYECYCELDIPGFEHRDSKGITGLELPYRVTIEKGTRQILEIRRNWADDGSDMPTPRKVFVKYPFNPAMGFYDIGLLQMLGNTTRAATAGWREMLDAGMFSCFPGTVHVKTPGMRNVVNNFNVPPGGSMGIETGGLPINQAVMALPYNAPSPALMQLIDNIIQTGQRSGGTSEVAVGEGRQDAPVGTTIALIEQSTKVMSAVHKGLHAAQAEEFQLLKERFKEDPEALWRNNRRAAKQWDIEKFLAALDLVELVPVADPNAPSHMHRMAKAEALRNLVTQAPMLFDIPKVTIRYMKEIGISDGEQYMAQNSGPPPPPQIDPVKAAELQLKAKQLEIDAAHDAAEIQSKEKIASWGIVGHPDHNGAPPPADQLKAADVQLKAQDNETKRMELALKSQELKDNTISRERDRQSKELIAADQLARQSVVHPAALPYVAEQLGPLRNLTMPSAMGGQGTPPPPVHPVGGLGRAPLIQSERAMPSGLPMRHGMPMRGPYMTTPRPLAPPMMGRPFP